MVIYGIALFFYILTLKAFKVSLYPIYTTVIKDEWSVCLPICPSIPPYINMSDDFPPRSPTFRSIVPKPSCRISWNASLEKLWRSRTARPILRNACALEPLALEAAQPGTRGCSARRRAPLLTTQRSVPSLPCPCTLCWQLMMIWHQNLVSSQHGSKSEAKQ